MELNILKLKGKYKIQNKTDQIWRQVTPEEKLPGRFAFELYIYIAVKQTMQLKPVWQAQESSARWRTLNTFHTKTKVGVNLI